jgi:IPT/TIG domain.
MHTNRISPARKFLLGLGLALSALFFSGCQTMVLSNLTPASLPENPSQIYTMTLRATPKTKAIPPESIEPKIIIDGRSHVMTKSPLGENLYEFDYQLPSGRDQLAYYFLVDYKVKGGEGQLNSSQAYTGLSQASIVRRYVLSLEVNRGPVGSRISILGRGFTPQDTVYFDSTPARTVFESPNSISFFVPALDPGRNYRVTLNSPSGNSPVGTFRVDSASVTVVPMSLMLRSGETQPLTFTVPNAAPPGGLLLDVTTDIPDSVIMPEVIVPQGQNTITVNVQGGQPGNGSLYLKGYGGGEVTIPVTVTGR